MSIRFASAKQITEAAINNYINDISREIAEEKHYEDIYHENAAKYEDIINKGNRKNFDIKRRSSFLTSAKSLLLVHALSSVVESCLDKTTKREYSNTGEIVSSLVSDYVNENGVDNILRKMSNSGPFIHEVANTINKYYKKIVEDCENCKPEDLTINPQIKDDFYNELDMVDSDSVTESIRQRVAASIQNWMYKNAEEKEEIKSELDKAGEAMSKFSDDEEVQESYSQIAKNKINKIRNREHSLFHNIVEGMCKTVLKKEEYQDSFMNEGKLDMDAIVTNCKIVYTFMETMASLKIADRKVLAEQVLNDINN